MAPQTPYRTNPLDIAADAYVRAERAERERLEARAARLAAAWEARAPGRDASEREIRAFEAAAAPTRDGAAATARLDARVRPAVATRYEGDARVCGPLARPNARVRPDLGAAQARVREATARADARAHTLERYRALRASCSPGGATWIRCNRTARRRLRAVVDRADALARAGDVASAIEVLLTE